MRAEYDDLMQPISEQELEEAMVGKARAEMAMLRNTELLGILAERVGADVADIEREFAETGGIKCGCDFFLFFFDSVALH
jgi:hypothetical protein